MIVEQFKYDRTREGGRDGGECLVGGDGDWWGWVRTAWESCVESSKAGRRLVE